MMTSEDLVKRVEDAIQDSMLREWESNVITPKVGDVVLYQSYGTPSGEYASESRAAIVTTVHPDNTVGLCILNPTGMFFNNAVRYGREPGEWRFRDV